MAWLLFLDPPREILQLGLGAGSLTKFCYRHCRGSGSPWSRSSRVVIEAAHQLVQAAAARRPPRSCAPMPASSWRGRRVKGRFGVVQVDLYDADAAGPVLDSAGFYRHCHAALAGPGVLTVNLFGRHASFRRSLERIARSLRPGRSRSTRAKKETWWCSRSRARRSRDRRELFGSGPTSCKARYGLPARGWAGPSRLPRR